MTVATDLSILEGENPDAALERGMGCLKVDPAKACAFFQKAAELGSVQAMVQLGVMYLGGRGIKVDSRESLRWFSLASERGSRIGHVRVALALIYGADGVAQDLDRAERLLFRVVDRFSEAWFFLATLYFKRGDIDRVHDAIVRGARVDEPRCHFHLAVWLVRDLVNRSVVLEPDIESAVIMLVRFSFERFRNVMPDDPRRARLANEILAVFENSDWRRDVAAIRRSLNEYGDRMETTRPLDLLRRLSRQERIVAELDRCEICRCSRFLGANSCDVCDGITCMNCRDKEWNAHRAVCCIAE